MASHENELHDLMEAHSTKQRREELQTQRRKESAQLWDEELAITGELDRPPIEDRPPSHAIAAN